MFFGDTEEHNAARNQSINYYLKLMAHKK